MRMHIDPSRHHDQPPRINLLSIRRQPLIDRRNPPTPNTKIRHDRIGRRGNEPTTHHEVIGHGRGLQRPPGTPAA